MHFLTVDEMLEAAANTIHGGASALMKSNRLKRMGGGYEADEIVSRIYASSSGVGVHKCRDCEAEYVDPDDAAACCREEDDE